MKRAFLLAAALLLVYAVPILAQDTHFVKIELSYARASDVMDVFQAKREFNQKDEDIPVLCRVLNIRMGEISLPSGITSLVAYDQDNALIAKGTTKGIIELKSLIQRLDRQPAQVRLTMRLIRFDFEKDGIADVEVVSTPTVMTFSNMKATVSTQGGDSGFSIEILPHVNPDGSIRLTGKMTMTEKEATRTVEIKRTLQKGQGRIIAGVTDSPVAAVQKAVKSGSIPGQPEKHTAYYLQVVPTLEGESKAASVK